jgi:hypothetical protein
MKIAENGTSNGIRIFQIVVKIIAIALSIAINYTDIAHILRKIAISFLLMCRIFIVYSIFASLQ